MVWEERRAHEIGWSTDIIQKRETKRNASLHRARTTQHYTLLPTRHEGAQTHQRTRQRTVSRVSLKCTKIGGFSTEKIVCTWEDVVPPGFVRFCLCIRPCHHHSYQITDYTAHALTAAMRGKRYRAVAISALLSAPVALAWSSPGPLCRSGRGSLAASASRTTAWTRFRTRSSCAPVAGSAKAQQVRTSAFWSISVVPWVEQAIPSAALLSCDLEQRFDRDHVQPPCDATGRVSETRNNNEQQARLGSGHKKRGRQPAKEVASRCC